jgi:hypothetical protein
MEKIAQKEFIICLSTPHLMFLILLGRLDKGDKNEGYLDRYSTSLGTYKYT